MKVKGTTTLESFSKECKVKQFYDPPPENTSLQDKRDLAGQAIANGIGMIIDNHFYEVGGQLYKQSDGGSMGLDVTSITSGVYMLTWDKDLIRKLIRLGFKIVIYKRFVDDITVFMAGINIGWYYCMTEDKMKYDRQNEFTDMSTETRTMTIIGMIADTIDKEIKVTTDSPSCNENGRVPILDIEVWVEQNRINHCFYRKPIASKYVIMNRSAMSASIKRNTLFQEGLKRVTYTRGGAQLYMKEGGPLEIEDDKVEMRLSDTAVDKFTEFTNMMRLSGYDQFYREKVIRGVFERVKTIEIDILKGKRQRYRNRQQIKAGHIAEMGRFTNTWFLKGGGVNTQVY